MSSSEDECEYSSDEELQEAFAKGLLKPGLNAVEVKKPEKANDVAGMTGKLNEIKLTLRWIERLDIINEPAPMAPELALQIQEEESKRERQMKGNRKLPQFKPGEDPVVNDFKRETMFHRQAQAAVIECFARIKKLGIPTIRPDDYFAEMCKTDEHMDKIRKNLAKKQLIAQRSEKIRQLRQQRKIGKQMQIESTLKKHAEKRQMMEDIKSYRKGAKKDLSFLNDKNKNSSVKKNTDKNRMNRGSIKRRENKNAKFGFGGKKRDTKRNTKESSADIFGNNQRGKKNLKNKNSRPGKNRRVQMKNRKGKK